MGYGLRLLAAGRKPLLAGISSRQARKEAAMRVQINDGDGCMHTIDSLNPALIGKWFAEKVEYFMSANTRVFHPVSMDIWPSTEHERLMIGRQSIRPITQDALLELVRHLLNVSEKLGELERESEDVRIFSD
jgi:hypothetical protein